MRKKFLKKIQVHLERVNVHSLLFTQHQKSRNQCLDVVVNVKFTDRFPIPWRFPNNRRASHLALSLDRRRLLELRFERRLDRTRHELRGVEVGGPLPEGLSEENRGVLDEGDENGGVDEFPDLSLELVVRNVVGERHGSVGVGEEVHDELLPALLVGAACHREQLRAEGQFALLDAAPQNFVDLGSAEVGEVEFAHIVEADRLAGE